MGCSSSKSKSKNIDFVDDDDKIVFSRRKTTFNGVFKLILTGDCGVGKSLFFHQFFNSLDNFDQKSTPVKGDNNAKLVKIEGKGDFAVTVWDTAGQEKYQAITNIFYKGSSGVLLVYDVTNKNSFDRIENYWITNVENNIKVDIKDIVFCLIANKIDKEDRCVTQEDGEILAKKLGALYRETSAIHNIGVVETITECVKLCTTF